MAPARFPTVSGCPAASDGLRASPPSARGRTPPGDTFLRRKKISSIFTSRKPFFLTSGAVGGSSGDPSASSASSRLLRRRLLRRAGSSSGPRCPACSREGAGLAAAFDRAWRSTWRGAVLPASAAGSSLLLGPRLGAELPAASRSPGAPPSRRAWCPRTSRSRVREAPLWPLLLGIHCAPPGACEPPTLATMKMLFRRKGLWKNAMLRCPCSTETCHPCYPLHLPSHS